MLPSCVRRGPRAYSPREAGGGRAARQPGQAGNGAAPTSFRPGRSPVSFFSSSKFCRRTVPDGAGCRRLATRLSREMVVPESFSACVGGRTATRDSGLVRFRAGLVKKGAMKFCLRRWEAGVAATGFPQAIRPVPLEFWGVWKDFVNQISTANVKLSGQTTLTGC